MGRNRSPHHPPAPIAIIGAGIGGLTAAVALRATGRIVDVYEQAGQFTRVGAGLQMAPNATKALQPLGLLRAVARRACHPATWRSYNALDGRLELEQPLGREVADRYGGPYLHVHRGDLHDALAHRVGPVHLGHRLTGLDAAAGGIHLTFENGVTTQASAVIGADGVHSTVRQILFGAEKARFSRMVAYRGLVPAERVADLEVEPIAAKWWSDDRHLVHYFISGGRELNYVAPVPAEHWDEESWTATGSVGTLLDALSDFVPPVRRIVERTDTVMCSALYDRDPLPHWTDGRLTLLGDAAHPMLPFMASGAAMAIEDAVVLTRCFDTVGAAGAGDAAAAFRLYETTRIGRATAAQMGSRGNTFLRGRSPDEAAPVPTIDELYGYDAWRVPLGAAGTEQ
jgi:2-polyprenyl-6-methoxyphenol hydroxylase-like FAD-dependent oxidoreductase